MNEAAEKLCSIRHYCFVRGVLGHGGRKGGDEDFRQAFRTINRLYVEAKRSGVSEGHVHPLYSGGRRRRKAA